jgi:predicted MFS family arabinose efflux permease
LFSKVFRAFHYRDFRLMWIGACTSSIGTWMQKLAQSWLVYALSKDAFYLGLDVFLGEIPIFLLSLFGGVFADRTNRRNILLVSQVIQMSCAFTLATLFALGMVQVWHILSLSFITGVAQAFGGPAYQALIPTLVNKEDLPNAIALNSIQFNVARVIGPVLGGLALNKLGASWCFSLNGLSFLAVIATLLAIHVGYIPARTNESVLESMKQGLRFILAQPGMAALIVLAFSMTMLGIPLVNFLPVFAKEVFHGGPETFTNLLVASGIGAIAGALVVAAVGKVKNQGKLALTFLIAQGALTAAFSFSRNLYLSCVLIFFGGAALIAVFALISSLVQSITGDSMRGRVMSVYNVAFRGGMPIGSLVVGALIGDWLHFPAPPTIAATGVLLSLMGAYLLFFDRRIAHL